MQGFRNVLFVTEGNRNEHAALLHLAEDLQASGGKLTLIDVVQEAPAAYASLPMKGGLAKLQKTIVKERSGVLKQMAAELSVQLPGLQVRSLVREGTDFLEIIRQAQKGKHDLVAKVAGDEGRIEGLLFGTLDMNLLRKCAVPVLILKGRKKVKSNRVVAAVDLVRSDAGRAGLDRQVVDLAALVARRSEGRLDILHAWHLPFEKLLRTDELDRDFGTVDTMLRELRSKEQHELDSLASDFADLAPDLHLIKGKPQDVIPRFIRNHRVQLVVMGTVGRSGVAGLFIGNTAEKILLNLNCSVLALKPAGFKSPVL
jgi:nucleotide-binding universal stress UspA family protein